MDFHAVSLLDFKMNDTCHSMDFTDLINVATLPCESQKTLKMHLNTA